jgi:hypothetical protein
MTYGNSFLVSLIFNDNLSYLHKKVTEGASVGPKEQIQWKCRAVQQIFDYRQ